MPALDWLRDGGTPVTGNAATPELRPGYACETLSNARTLTVLAADGMRSQSCA